MKKVILSLLVCILVSSCGNLRSRGYRTETSVKSSKSIYTPRSVKYIKCVRDLNRDGLKQKLIKNLCDSALGSLDE